MDVIHKGPGDLKVTPNLTDYEQTRASFDWSAVPEVCAGMGEGGCNIAYAAVDRHAEGPEAGRTALRFIADDPDSAELTTHDVSYAELGRLTRKFTNVLRGLEIGKGDRVFVIMGRVPELYISMLGALRNGSVVSPLFSAFGPEPIATRVTIGSADVIVTTAAIYKRKIAKIRDQLTSVKHVLVVSDDDAELPGTLNFHRLMDEAPEDAPIERTDPTIRRCCTSPAAPPEPPRAPSTCTARWPCTTSPAATRSTCTTATSIGAQPIPAGSPALPTGSSRRCCTGSPRSSTRPSSTPNAGTGSCRTRRSASGTPHRRPSAC